MNIGLERVVWIYCNTSLLSVEENNRVHQKLQIELVAFILIHYLHVEVFYFWIKRERHSLNSTTEKVFKPFF